MLLLMTMGVKRNILRMLVERGAAYTVCTGRQPASDGIGQ